MEEGLKRSLTVAGAKAAYDEHVKQILARKIVLAHLLVGVVPEYAGMEPEEVVPLIEQEPEISEVPVLPGETNQPGEETLSGFSGKTSQLKQELPQVSGMSTESKVPYEGTITYDIRFSVWHPDRKKKHKIIVDVEAQKEKPGQYDIVTRGIFYNARQLSAQLGTEFEIPKYGDLKKVYSIWICINVPSYLENTAAIYEMQERDLVGTLKRAGYYDLLAVIEINLSKEMAEEKEGFRLHRFLETIFSRTLLPEKKIDILEQEYGIPMTGQWREGMEQMCNLSEAIEEEGIRKGILREQENTERERRRAEEESRRAEQESHRAEQESRRAEQAEEEIARLKLEVNRLKRSISL